MTRQRLVRGLLWGLASVLALVLVLVLVVVLGSNTPWARRQLCERVNAALADSFQGSLRVTELGHVGLAGVSGVHAVVLDRAGRNVIAVSDLQVSLGVLPLVWELVVERPRDLHIDIDAVELGDGRVHLIDAGSGVPTLASAFSPRTQGPPSEGTTSVTIGRARFRHVWVHGSLSGTRIDADLAELAAHLEVTGSAVGLEIQQARLQARGLPGRADPKGELAGKLEVAIGQSQAPLAASVRFDGEARALEARSARVSARAAVVGGSISAHAAARLGPAELDAEFSLDTDARSLTTAARARGLDLSLLDPELPQSALFAALTATGRYTPDGELGVDYRVRLGESQLRAVALPVTEGTGVFELSRAERAAPLVWSTRGELRIDEPGAATVVQYTAEGQAAGPRVQLSGATTLADPARLVALAPGLRVRGQLQTRARLDLGSKQVEVEAQASLPELDTPSASLERVELRASAAGALAQPELALDAEVATLAVADRVYRGASLRASGTPARLRVDAGTRAPRLAGGAFVTLQPNVLIEDAALRLGSGDEVLSAQAASIRVGGGRIVGDDVRLHTGSGWVRASFEYAGELRKLRLVARNFDLAEAAAPFELAQRVPRGVVTADVQLDREPLGTSGYVEAGAKEVGYASVAGVTLNLSARLRRGLVAGGIDARWRGSAASVNIDDLPLQAVSPLRPSELHGRLAGEATVELDEIEPLLELGLVPLETAGGRAKLELLLDKRRHEPLRLEAALATSRLHLVGKRKELEGATAEEARRAQPWSSTGTDVDLSLALDEATRELSLDATILDAKGKLARIQSDARWPGEAALLPLARWPSLWQRVETTAHLWLLPRKISDWPAPLAVTVLDGTASLSVHATGSYQNPSVRWSAQLEDFGPPDAVHAGLEMTASGDYRPDAATLRLGVEAKARRVAELEAEWRGDAVKDLLAGREPARAKLRGRFDRFPVSAVPLLTSQRVAGHLSGVFTVERDENAWQAQVGLDSRDLSVARIAAERLRLRASLEQGRLEASLRAAGRALGSIDAAVSGSAPFGEQTANAPLQVELNARDFQLRTLDPLVAGSVSGLEGRLNADLKGELSTEAPRLRGHIAVSRGAAELPALGQTLHAIEARVEVDHGRVDLRRLEARGLTGKLKARGSATLNGLAVSSAEASVAIAERDKIPLMLRGVTLGDAWGRASVRYRPVNERRRELDVNIERFALELPDVSPPGVQSLEPAAYVEVGHQTRSGEFVEIPLQPIEREEAGPPQRWIIGVKLGAIEIHKGPGIAIGLEGNLKARVGRKTRLQGRIDLTGGKIDVSGKEFKIERGSLTFDRTEVDQGVVTATARWDSPAEYTVYAEYSGTVEQGELKLRSEPPLTQDEILALLMFGTPTGSFGAKSKSEAATAVGIAGGTVTKGLNRALSDMSNLDLSTRVDTSTGEARPELVLQVTPRATARVTQALGEAPPGQSPDRTFLTVDLRLFTRWSLSAQVGDEGGSSLDLIWRHRY